MGATAACLVQKVRDVERGRENQINPLLVADTSSASTHTECCELQSDRSVMTIHEPIPLDESQRYEYV